VTGSKIGARTIVIILVFVVIAGAGVVYQFMRPTEGIDVKLILVHGSNPQKITVELKCTGNQPAYIYKILWTWGYTINYTFAEDIVVPPGSEVRITFPSIGGDVTIVTLSGETASGGGTAIMEGNFPPEYGGRWPVTGYAIPVIVSRAGNEYRHTAAFQSEEYIPG